MVVVIHTKPAFFVEKHLFGEQVAHRQFLWLEGGEEGVDNSLRCKCNGDDWMCSGLVLGKDVESVSVRLPPQRMVEQGG